MFSSRFDFKIQRMLYSKSAEYGISVYHELDPLPPQSRVIGKVSINNAVPSMVNCDYTDVVKLEKWKARKVGGDALQITKITLPDEENSCYGISANVIAFDPIEKYGGVGSDVQLSSGYFVVMQHPVTTEYKLARKQVTETLKAVNSIDLPILWFWPNVDAGSDGTSRGIRAFRESTENKNIWFFKKAIGKRNQP